MGQEKKDITKAKLRKIERARNKRNGGENRQKSNTSNQPASQQTASIPIQIHSAQLDDMMTNILFLEIEYKIRQHELFENS